jgi:signal transduction histidine kinase
MWRRGLVPWIAGAVLGLVAESVGFGWRDPAKWVPDLVVGWMFMGCGLVAARRRPESRSGGLMAATGYSWFIGNFKPVGVGALSWAAVRGRYLYRGPLVHSILSYPSGRTTSRLVRAGIVVGYAAAIMTWVWTRDAATIVLSAGLVGVSVRTYVRAVGRDRRSRLLSVWAAVGLGGALAGGAAARLTLPGEIGRMPTLALELVLCCIAGGFLVGLLTTPWQRAEVTDLVVELGDARSGTLRGELSRALGDPSLEVGYWLAETDAFVDAEGRVLPIPDPDSGRSVTIVRREGQPVAALVHDPAVLDDPGLLEAVTSAAQLASSRARLQAEVQAQVVEIEASRQRVLAAGEDERRRLERRLHDGSERRLAGLATTLRRARAMAQGPRTNKQIARADDQLSRTLEDLDRLAHGLRPRALAEQGLGAALRALTADLPIPVEVDVESWSLPAQLEVVVYFVCSEALANAAKHACASRVAVSVTSRDGRVKTQIDDDGVGGADPARGSGLRGLADRVESVGGTLCVESVRGGGTRLIADIPVRGNA